MSQRRIRRRGQGLVEVAIVVPLLIALLTGVWAAAELIAAENHGTEASRDAARIGSELGNNHWSAGSPTDPTAVDTNIVDAAMQAMQNVTGTTITEIDVYQPTSQDGQYSPSDLVDCYTISGTTVTPLPSGLSPGGVHCAPGRAYTLDNRSQIQGSESWLGVRVTFTYRSPAPVLRLFDGTHTVYTVMQLNPIL